MVVRSAAKSYKRTPLKKKCAATTVSFLRVAIVSLFSLDCAIFLIENVWSSSVNFKMSPCTSDFKQQNILKGVVFRCLFSTMLPMPRG